MCEFNNDIGLAFSIFEPLRNIDGVRFIELDSCFSLFKIDLVKNFGFFVFAETISIETGSC